MFLPTHYVRGGATHAHRLDDHYPIWPKLEYRLPACIVWLYKASSSTMSWFPDNFFLLGVQPLGVGIFKSLKSNYNNECKKYMAQHPGRVITTEAIASLVQRAWPLSLTPINISYIHLPSYESCASYSPGSTAPNFSSDQGTLLNF